MPARILVVDDQALNRKLMHARLERAYYMVLTASSGEEALSILERESVDLVLLDILMPGIDGYETCRRIKAGSRTHDLPVVLTTSLDQPEDRIEGVAAGADDFLTKPVADLPLFSRLRSLTRMKHASDDLRAKLGPLAPIGSVFAEDDQKPITGSVLVVDDAGDPEGLIRALRGEHVARSAVTIEDAIQQAENGTELILVNLAAVGFDPLAVCSNLRSNPATRYLPVLGVAPELEASIIWRALDLGIDDYVPLPVDRLELTTRIGTHLRRRRQDEALKLAVHDSAELAFVDPLTGLGNRRTLEDRLAEFVAAARRGARPFSILMADLDNFKTINDRFGHPAGDLVLREFARRLNAGIRENDVACRLGGEEFIVLLDGIEEGMAESAAERLRQSTREGDFTVAEARLKVTVSIGVAQWAPGEEPGALMDRADRALYRAKWAGRDRVETASRSAAILNHL